MSNSSERPPVNAGLKKLKLAKINYKTSRDWLRKVIYWGLCKRLKFDYSNRWHKHKPESILENENQVGRVRNS